MAFFKKRALRKRKEELDMELQLHLKLFSKYCSELYGEAKSLDSVSKSIDKEIVECEEIALQRLEQFIQFKNECCEILRIGNEIKEINKELIK